MNANASVVALLSRSSVLSILPPETLRALAAQLRLTELEAGDYLFFQQDPADSLYVVERGRLRVFRATPDGRERTLAHLEAGDLIGEMALLDGLPRSASVQAIEPSRLWRLDRTNFLALIERNPKLAIAIIQLLARRLRGANAQLEEVVVGPVPDRLTRVLIRLARAAPVPPGPPSLQRLGVTQQELANLTGTTRESVSRSLRRLQQQGVVVRRTRGAIWVDRARLLAADS